MVKRLIPVAFLVAFWILVGLYQPRFWAIGSVDSVLLNLPVILLLATGQLLVILSGGIDISVGSTLAFSGIAVGMVFSSAPHLPIPFAFGLGAFIGLLLGCVNGCLIAYAKIPPLIVTIGTLASFRGLTFLLSHGNQVDASSIPDSLIGLAKQGSLLWIALAFAALAHFALNFVPAGRNVFTFGSSPTAARLKGIDGPRVQLGVYALSGAFAGLASVVYLSRFGFVNPGSAGQGFELTAIAAVAIGGAKLTGGEGSVPLTVIGCLLLASIQVALPVLGIDKNWQLLANGLVILAAILVHGALHRRSAA